MSSDYRCTDYCPPFDRLERKKQVFSRSFHRRYPTQNHFIKINKKSSSEHKMFQELYNHKCVYCGVSDTINQEFEVDHYKCRNDQGLDVIDNLVYSCRKCNRGKSKYPFQPGYEQVLNPISNIQNIFVRNEDYSIIINNSYKTDTVICNFYKSIKFADDVRRLDYLLMNLIGLQKQIQNELIKDKLDNCIRTLLLRRNDILH